MIPEFIAVGTNTAITAPASGAPWVTGTIPAGTYRSVTSNGAIVVAVGDSVAASFDGITWTARTIPAGQYLAVVWTGKLFVAVGTSVAATSPDGITWTARTIPAGSYHGESWNGSVISAVGVSVAATSPDGITWTARTIPAGQYNAIAWNGTVFAAVGLSSVAASSPDGITWTSRTITPAATAWNAIAWNGTVFAAVNSTNNGSSATSPDGITWTQRTFPAGLFFAIAWSGSVFSAVGTAAAISTDGASWSTVAFSYTVLAEIFSWALSATVQDTHRVRATIVVSPLLADAPLAASASGTGDTLNRLTWAIVNNVTGAAATVLKSAKINTTTFDIYIAGDFTLDQYQLSASLANIYGNALQLAPATFTGSQPALQPTSSGSGQSLPVDLRNAVVQSQMTIGGTLVVGPDGDYVIESGESLIKKLILRRLTTAPGAFFHLPAYGLGLQEKNLIKPSTLGSLKRQIELQVSQEPELQDVSASVVWVPASGTLEVRVVGTLVRTGQPFTAAAKLPLQL